MTTIFEEIRSAVVCAQSMAGFPPPGILSILHIPGSWYYRHLDPDLSPACRFNPFAVLDDEALRLTNVLAQSSINPGISKRNVLIAKIFFLTGVRIGEFIGWDQKQIRMRSENGEADRNVFLHPDLFIELMDYIRSPRPRTDDQHV